MTPHRKKAICEAIGELIHQGEQLLAELGPNIWHGQTMLHSEGATIRVTAFLQQCHAVVDQIGGDARTWKSLFSCPDPDVNIMRQIVGVLQGLKDSVERGLMDGSEELVSPIQLPLAPESSWALLHPKIVDIARSRFESRHFADAVEAAFKLLNQEVKCLVRDANGEELDGAQLMTRAFSVKQPIIELDDQSTQSGRDA